MGGRVMREGCLRSTASFALLIILLLQETVASASDIKRSDGVHFGVVGASTEAAAGRKHALKKKPSVPAVRGRDIGCIAEPHVCATHKHERCCRGWCRNLHSVAMNCSACGRFCPHGYACSAGSCVDLSHDHANCGKCENVCPSGLSCQRGLCGYDE
ncbi:hypothetical protein KP509_1Z092900 [Ceratopteris richardii]|nr:hypothetical protein KP509_1Z092900 [Ceratopteris richardii]